MKCIFNLCYWIFIFPAAVDCIICQSHLMLRDLTLSCQTVEGYTNFFISCFSLILAPSFFTFSISSMVCLGGVFVFLDFCRNHKFSDLLIQLFINWYHNQHGSFICKKLPNKHRLWDRCLPNMNPSKNNNDTRPQKKLCKHDIPLTFFSLFRLFLLPADEGGVASGDTGSVADDTRLISSLGDSSWTDFVFPLGPALISMGGATAGLSPIWA